MSRRMNNYKGVDKWMEANQNKYLCNCGCGDFIVIKNHHFSVGIPQYIHGHHSNTEWFKAERQRYNELHLGELSSRWVEDRSKVRTWRKNFLSSQKREIYVRDNGICQNCGAFTLLNVNKYDPLKANFDHIIPVKDDGKTEISNGQTFCLICHKFKHSAKAKTANSVDAKAKAMPIPNQAEDKNSPACVETDVQSSKEMIQSDTPLKSGD